MHLPTVMLTKPSQWPTAECNKANAVSTFSSFTALCQESLNLSMLLYRIVKLKALLTACPITHCQLIELIEAQNLDSIFSHIYSKLS